MIRATSSAESLIFAIARRLGYRRQYHHASALYESADSSNSSAWIVGLAYLSSSASSTFDFVTPDKLLNACWSIRRVMQKWPVVYEAKAGRHTLVIVALSVFISSCTLSVTLSKSFACLAY